MIKGKLWVDMRLICTKAKNSSVVGTGISVGKKKIEELKSK
jgi:hypothetical protein